MSRIYVSSSWRNGFQPAFVKDLRDHGHKVYDFRHPEGRDDVNVWEPVTTALGLHSKYNAHVLVPEEYSRMLDHAEAVSRFREHFAAMQDADTCILLLPCGDSSHCEAGIMKGMGKRVLVMDTRQHVEPELMYLMFDGYTYDVEDIFKWVSEPIPGVCRICGCTEENPCFHPHAGTCWRVDPSLCSHCAENLGLLNNPQTIHCINDKSKAFK